MYQKTMNSLTAVNYVTCRQSKSRLAKYANMQDANSAAIIKYLSLTNFDKFHNSMQAMCGTLQNETERK